MSTVNLRKISWGKAHKSPEIRRTREIAPIPEDQWCYEIKGQVAKLKENFLSLTGYRLPTEAEMEYATRAGALTSRYYGETEELLPKYEWYNKNSQQMTWPVGSLKPNDLGLFDVQGNVLTWCHETYPTRKGEEAAEDKEDQSVTAPTQSRMLRGGMFNGTASNVRSAFRLEVTPTVRGGSFGLRPTRTLPLGSFTALPPTLKGNAEHLALAQFAYDGKKFAAAARLWAEALESDPKLGDDRRTQLRYDAACTASLAAAGQGKDEPPLDDAAKAKLRRQALDWLKADLTAWSKLLDSGPPQARPTLVQTLSHWQKDDDLAGLRDAAALAKLPADEQKALAQLWADVAALLKKAEEKPK